MAGESSLWIASDGVTQINLSDPDTLCLIEDASGNGRQGLYFPPIALQDQRSPLTAGSIMRYVDTLPRPLVLPLLVSAPDEPSLSTLIRQCALWFDTPAGSP